MMAILSQVTKKTIFPQTLAMWGPQLPRMLLKMDILVSAHTWKSESLGGDSMNLDILTSSLVVLVP